MTHPSRDCERAVLAAMTLNNDTIDLVTPHLSADDFADAKHRAVYAAILHLHGTGTPVDGITLKGALDPAGIGTPLGVYLSDLFTAEGWACHAEQYAKEVKAHAIKRAIAARLDEAQAALSKHSTVTLDAVRVIAGDLLDLALSTHGNEPVSMKDAAHAWADSLERAERMAPVPTGFCDLDTPLAGGIRAGELVVVAARPGVGKTTIALNMVAHAAEHKHGALYFIMEMGREQLFAKALANEANISVQKLRAGRLPHSIQEPVSFGVGALSEWPVWIDDSASLSVGEIRAKARRHTARHPKTRVLVVDYLQQLRASSRKDRTRDQEVGEMTRALKCLARELNVAVLLLCQLNRAGAVEPNLTHLRESGNIEQDADVVLLLHRPNEGSMNVKATIAKNRMGPLGHASLLFDGEHQRFRCEAKF